MNQLYKVIFKVAEFEKRREAERKRNEEEKRRARRDRMLLEKAARDKKGVEEKKAAEEIEELHNKVRVLLQLILWLDDATAGRCVQIRSNESPRTSIDPIFSWPNCKMSCNGRSSSIRHQFRSCKSRSSSWSVKTSTCMRRTTSSS